ncbi:hypothetical protein AMECASPLE_039013 [Ameca splendens]|uniref:Uncharacterized protein n=1 Tax=Ameca splendens TaxID=208324 RepID=A0ABV0XLF2_9TELE
MPPKDYTQPQPSPGEGVGRMDRGGRRLTNGQESPGGFEKHGCLPGGGHRTGHGQPRWLYVACGGAPVEYHWDRPGILVSLPTFRHHQGGIHAIMHNPCEGL